MLNNYTHILDNKLTVTRTFDGKATVSPNMLPKKRIFSIIQSISNRNNFLYIKFRLFINGQEIDFSLKGQKAKTLKCLIESNGKGCTALEISKTFALRLSEYIRSLRHDGLAGGHNLEIIMIREKNPSNWHGRYYLKSHVKIVEVVFN